MSAQLEGVKSEFETALGTDPVKGLYGDKSAKGLCCAVVLERSRLNSDSRKILQIAAGLLSEGGAKLERVNAQTPLSQEARCLTRAAADLEHPVFRAQAATLQRGVHEFSGWRRSHPVIALGFAVKGGSEVLAYLVAHI